MISGMCKMALKEWDVIVSALASGQQSILLKKGGLRESKPRFEVKYDEFFMYPTYYHQSRQFLKPSATDLNHESEQDIDGVVTLSVFVEVSSIFEIHTQEEIMSIEPFHIFNNSLLTKKFNWRPSQPLTLLIIRAYVLQQPQALMVMDEYIGCKSWVEFIEEYPVGVAKPAINERRFIQLKSRITQALSPGLNK